MWIGSDLGVYCKNWVDTYDRDEGGLDLELLINPLVLGGIVSQLLIVLILSASFENTRREVL